MKHLLRDILAPILLAVAIFFLLHTFVPSYVIASPSMEPSLLVNQRILVSKISYNFHEPERGDIITFYPQGDREAIPYIKRIIGLPGETVEIKQGVVYIHKGDGTVLTLDEPYIKEAPTRPYYGDIIPDNEYFVLGDNRNNSSDSRTGWTVKYEYIIGKAWISIWPPQEWGLAPNHSSP
jgi:signal peptidase I